MPDVLLPTSLMPAPKTAGATLPHVSPGRATQERIARRLLDAFERTQHSAAGFLRAFGFKGDLDAFLEFELPTMPEDRLWQFCSRISVELADAEGRAGGRAPFRSSDWRVLFYCLLGSRTLQEAIFRLEDVFESVDGRFGAISQSARGNLAMLTFTAIRGPDRETAFIVALNGLAMYHSLLSWAIGQPLGELAEFDFPEAIRPLADAELLPFELVLGCDETALLFSPALLHAPIVRSMADCDRLPSLNPAMQMARGEIAGDIASRVWRTLHARLLSQQALLSLDECAAILGMSGSTMRRRIRGQGATFRALCDDVRRTVAIKLLADPNISIEDVATRLDFCDSNALRSASQKWLGMAPREYRKLLLREDAGD